MNQQGNETSTDRLMADVLNAPAETGPAASTLHPTGVKERVLEQQILEVISTIYDPEIPVNIYELGLIYDLKVSPNGVVDVKMTLTSPACPVAGTLPIEVENKIAAIPGVTNVNLELVWEPPYSMDMMSEAARLDLGLL